MRDGCAFPYGLALSTGLRPPWFIGWQFLIVGKTADISGNFKGRSPSERATPYGKAQPSLTTDGKAVCEQLLFGCGLSRAVSVVSKLLR